MAEAKKTESAQKGEVKKAPAKKEAKAEVKKESKPKAPAIVEAAEKTYSIRGNIFEGIVVSAKADKTVTVERELTHFIGKYERYKKIKSKIRAHNPKSIGAKEGDRVRVGETRKISKTKNFIVMEVLGDKK